MLAVRANRSKPGLQPQHLAAVKAAAEICDANLTDARIGSTQFVFEPTADVRAGEYSFDIGTAGSAPLVAQTVILPLALIGAPCRIRVNGGTHNPLAPSSDYLEHVYAPALRDMGVSISITSPRAGFYPAGGGSIEIELVGASQLHPIERARRGPAHDVRAIVTTSQLGDSVFYRSRDLLEERLNKVTVKHEDKESNGPGAAVVLIANHGKGHAGFTGLGERGKPMERVTEEAINDYRRWRDQSAAVDEHLADQLVLPAAFASGESSWTTPEVTEHLRTVLWLVNQFVPIEFMVGETVKVRPA